MTIQIIHTQGEAGVCLEWHEIDELIFDSDLFDAEVLVERSGISEFDRRLLANSFASPHRPFGGESLKDVFRHPTAMN